jgi:hypothetical protein
MDALQFQMRRLAAEPPGAEKPPQKPPAVSKMS